MGAHGLVGSTRTLWRAFALQPPLLVIVTLWGAETTTSVPTTLPLVLLVTVVMVAVATVVALDRTSAAAVPEDHEDALRTTRNRQLVQQAIAVAPAWMALALAFALGPAWLVLVGAAGSSVATWLCRPTVERFARIEAAWRAGGSGVSPLRGYGARRDSDGPDDDAPGPMAG